MAFVRRHARMTALSLILTAGSAGAASLRELPAEVLADLIDDTEASDPGDPERTRMLSLLAMDGRPEVRAHVAEAAGARWPEAREQLGELLRQLAADSTAEVRFAAASGLAQAIQRASPPERIDLVCRWALAESPHERAAVGRALAHGTPVFVADLVIEQLAQDDSDEVRAAAIVAAAKHFHEDFATYTRIAERAAVDPDPSVRRLAQALLSQAS